MFIRTISSVAVLILCFFTLNTIACTGLQVSTTEGAYVNGRTVEFGMPLALSVLIVPQNYHFTGSLPNEKSGIEYRAKYAVVGASVFGEASVVDGINEKGLSAGAFYFPGYASYAKVLPGHEKSALAPTEFINWILTQFANIEEVKHAIGSIMIAATPNEKWGGVPPFHYIIYDKSGRSIVVEPLNGELAIFDNPLGVFTNSPTFDWHLTNLSNYINLSPSNAQLHALGKFQLKQFGQGTGLQGLPGDFTPPSRFVRAAIFSAASIPAAHLDKAVSNIFHLLNQFDIPYGAVRESSNHTTHIEWTLATTVKDPSRLRYYYKTFEDQTVRMIDMNRYDLTEPNLVSIKISA